MPEFQVIPVKKGGRMNKLISIEEAVSKVKDGDTIMVGGFLANGTPLKLIDALAESGVKDLTLICNDTSFVNKVLARWWSISNLRKSLLPT